MTLSKSEAYRLSKKASEMDARVLRGVLTLSAAGAKIDEVDLLEWLAQHADSEVVLIAAPVEDRHVSNEMRTCQTCGRDYVGDSCAHCRKVRARLRGT